MDRIAAEARQLLLRRRGVLDGPAEDRAGVRPEPEQRELAEIDAALARIEDGSYGRCQLCGHAIGYQRLRAVPETRTCTDCSSRPVRAA